MERLSEEKDKLLAELGFSSSADLVIRDSNGDGDDLVSTPFCSHKFCTTCWRDYLNESLQKKERVVMISCPDKECNACVGPDTIVQLPEDVQEMYNDYILGSFIESKKEPIKLCPGPGCNFAIERPDESCPEPGFNYAKKRCVDDVLEDDDVELEEDEEKESSDLGVVCLCGQIFCWTCQLESHRPVTCQNASLWLNRHLDQAKSLIWIATNTKRCPDCNSPVQRNDDPYHKYVTCICRYTFCWLCLRSKEEHKEIFNCSEVSIPPPEHVSNLTHNLKLWDETHEAMEKAKSHLINCMSKLTEDSGLGGEQVIKAVKEAGMLVVQCRLVLKWTYVFDYFFNDYLSAKKHYLNHLRDQALTILSKHEETLHELMNPEESSTLLVHKLETTTSNTVKYFHSFVKTFEDALTEVEVDASKNVPLEDWFCDRCTFQNIGSDTECKMCLTPLVSPSHVAFGYNNIASDHHQVPNMPNKSIENDMS